MDGATDGAVDGAGAETAAGAQAGVISLQDGSFDEAWLALREPHDHAARARVGIETRLPQRRHWRAIDVAGGTGSNIRYLAPRLGTVQEWQLLDNDPALLRLAAVRFMAWASALGGRCEVQPVDSESTVASLQLAVPGIDDKPRSVGISLCQVDLADLDSWLAPPSTEPLLVTASALLDLVTAPWLRAFVQRMAALRADLLLSLSWDGRVEWRPALPEDAALRDALDADQRRDKGRGSVGEGAALGPGAVDFLLREMREPAAREAWKEVHPLRVDWELGPAERELQEQLLQDWTRVAQAGDASFAAWAQQRRHLIEAGESRLRVGHLDVLALAG